VSDPYEVLGVGPDASAGEIRRAYLALARRHHPDAVAGATPAERAAAEQRMRDVNSAWAVLGNAERRRAHDAACAGAADEGSSFRPFDPGDDDVDPHDLPDRPYRADPDADTIRRRTATLAPAALFVGALAAGAVGLVIGAPGVLGLAVALFVLACVGFLVLPLLALSRATRDEG
jgi:curved DNA-binding protein CbpA